MRNITAALGASTALALASPALAGLVTGTTDIQAMYAGFGFADAEAPDPFGFVDVATIADPVVGSLVLLGGSIPGTGSFSSRLEYAFDEGEDVFNFTAGLLAAPFTGTPFEYAVAGSRLDVTTETFLRISLRGLLSGSGAGRGYLNLFGDGSPVTLIAPSADEIAIDLIVGPGAYIILWGSIVGPLGGSAEFEGTLTLTSVPAPGSAALLVAAGLLTGIRRRRG